MKFITLSNVNHVFCQHHSCLEEHLYFIKMRAKSTIRVCFVLDSRFQSFLRLKFYKLFKVIDHKTIIYVKNERILSFYFFYDLRIIWFILNVVSFMGWNKKIYNLINNNLHSSFCCPNCNSKLRNFTLFWIHFVYKCVLTERNTIYDKINISK